MKTSEIILDGEKIIVNNENHQLVFNCFEPSIAGEAYQTIMELNVKTLHAIQNNARRTQVIARRGGLNRD